MQGFESYRQDSSVISSTSRAGTMVFVDNLTLNPGQNGSKSYPNVAPGGLFIQSSATSHTVTTGTDGSGNACINWTALYASANTTPTDVMVMATKLVNASHGSGVDIRMDTGEVIVNTLYPPAQFVGYTDFNSGAATNQAVADGYTLYSHTSYSTISMGSGANRFLVLGLPDSGTNDTWYAVDTSMMKAGLSRTVTLLVYTKSSTYQLPRLFVFAINNPQPSSTSSGLQVFDPTGKLLYDAAAENLAITDMFNVSYPAYGTGTSTYTPSKRTATYYGVVMPSMYWVEDYTGSLGAMQRAGYGAMKLVNGQMTFRLMLDGTHPVNADNPAEYGDATTNLFCAVIDLTYLGFSLGTGTGGGSSNAAPQITSQPSNQTINLGGVCMFSLTATGNPAVTYQWYRGSTAISGATGSSYSFTPVAGDSGASFYCQVRNTVGTVQSNVVYLTVNNTGSTTPVTISTQPQNQSIVSGNAVTFSVAVAGTAPFTYQWYKNNVAINGATNASYTTTAVDTDNGATFQCVVTNGGGVYSATSQSATLTVSPAPTNAPVISTQPANVSVNQGQSASMSCSASPADRYQWYKDGVYIQDGATISLNTGTVGTFSYYCIVYNGQLSTQSSTATLTVNAPTSSSYPSYNDFSNTIDAENQNAEFDISRNGSTSGGINWANGTGDGTKYTVRASGNFTPAYGSFALNTDYDLATYSGVSWIAPGPSSTRPGDSSTYTLNVSVTLKGYGVVATGTITLRSTNVDTSGM